MMKTSFGILCLLFLWGPYLKAQPNLLPRQRTPNGPVDLLKRHENLLYVGGEMGGVGYYVGGIAKLPQGNEKPDLTFPATRTASASFQSGRVEVAVPDGQGGWYLGGSFGQVDVEEARNLVHVLPNGKVDPDFQAFPNNTVRALLRKGDTLFVAGSFTLVDGRSRPYICALDIQTQAILPFQLDIDGSIYDLEIHGDTLVMAGSFTRFFGLAQRGLARIKLTTMQMIQTISTTNGLIYDLERQGNTLYAAGNFFDQVGNYVGRMAKFAQGDSTSSFNFPFVDGDVNAMVADGSGGWYVGGNFREINDLPIAYFAHVRANNTVDTSFNFGLDGEVNDMVRRGDSLILGGDFQQIQGQNRTHLAAIFLPNKQLLSWDPAPDNTVTSLHLTGDQLFVAGNFGLIAGNKQPRLAAISLTSQQILPLPTPASGTVLALTADASRLYVSGTFSDEVGTYTGGLARFEGNSPLPILDPLDIRGSVDYLLPDQAGGWYIGGNFTIINGRSVQRLAHIWPDGSLDTTFLFQVTGRVRQLLLRGNLLYLGGDFTRIGGIVRNRLAAIDLSTQSLASFDPNVNGAVYAMQAVGNSLYIGGFFTQVGGQTRNRLAAFDLSAQTLTNWHPDLNNPVYALATAGNQLIAGGTFTDVGGNPRTRLASFGIPAGTLTSWSPTCNGSVQTLLVSGNQLYIGGGFFQVDGQNRSRVARFDLGSATLDAWAPPTINLTVNTLAISGDSLFIGGGFTRIDGQSQPYLASLNPQTGALWPWNPKLDQAVNTLQHSGNQLWVGGNFKVAQAETRQRLFSLDLASLQLTDWIPTVNNSVRAMVLAGDSLYIGGNFTQVNGSPRQRLAKIHPQSNALSAWGPIVDNSINALALQGDTLFLGGAFTEVNGVDAPRMAAVSTSSGVVYPWFPRPGDEVFNIVVLGRQIVAGGKFQTFQGFERYRVMAIDLPSGGLIRRFAPRVEGVFAPFVRTLEVQGSTLYIGGGFMRVNGEPRTNLAALQAQTGQLRPFNPVLNEEVNALQIFQNQLMIAGEFTELNGLPRPYLGALDLIQGNTLPWDPQPDREVVSFQVDADTLYAMGWLSHLDYHQRSEAYAWDVKADTITDFDPQIPNILLDLLPAPDGQKVFAATSATINDVGLVALDAQSGDTLPGWTVHTNGSVTNLAYDFKREVLYFSGRFTEVNGQPRSHVAALDRNGSLLPFSITADGNIEALALRDTSLYLGGFFSTVNGQSREYLAAVNLDGELLAWYPEINAFPTKLLAMQDRIYLTGGFTRINGTGVSQVGAVDPFMGFPLPWDPNIVGAVNDVLPTFNSVVLAGEMRQTHDLPIRSLSLHGTLYDLPFSLPEIDFNQLQAITLAENVLIAGSTDQEADGQLYPYLHQIEYPGVTLDRRIVQVSPQQGGNIGDVTLRLIGFGFTKDTRVKLVGNGFTDIVGVDSATITYGGTYLETTFILRGQAPGMRDIVVEIPNDTVMVLQDAFTVVAGGQPEPYADLIIPQNIRVRTENSFYLTIGNTGTIDAHGVPVWIAVSPNLTITGFDAEVLVPVVDTSLAWVQNAPQYVLVDSFAGRPFKAKVYAFFVAKAAVGDIQTIRFTARADSAGAYYMRAWANNTMYGSPLKPIFGECLGSVLDAVLGATPAVGCVFGIYQGLTCPIFDATFDPNFGTTKWWGDYSLSLTGTVLGCLGDLFTGGTARVLAFMVEQSLTSKSLLESLQKCFEEELKREEDEQTDQGSIVFAYDPNDKVGPQGGGQLGWLPTHQPFTYLIRFENLATATAPAQQVIIRDTLDLSVFDWRTLRLAGFSIAGEFYDFPLHSKSAVAVIDLAPRIDEWVRVEADLDTLSGELTWTFTSLDPQTYAFTTDPLGGFLPPNTDTLSGTGSVLFHIYPKPGIPSHTAIENQAAIYFDTNAPIITNIWRNTADNDLPTSKVAALPDSVPTTAITLNWAGQDIGAGIRYYDVYVSEESSPFFLTATDLSDTTYTFMGEPGKTYAFYTIAHDSAANREVPPLTYDAITKIANGATLSVSPESTGNPLLKVYPNPTKGELTLDIEATHPGLFTYEIVDVVGRKHLSGQRPLSPGQQQIRLMLTAPKGVYVLRYSHNGRKGSQSIVLQP